MQASFKSLYPTEGITALESQTPVEPFSDDVIRFLNALSQSILSDRTSRAYPDVVSFAYFCRKGNLMQLKAQYCSPDRLRLGRGMVLHIAPSNVPVNFAYSMLAGLLAGNTNVVRVSSKDFPQVDMIVNCIAKIAAEHPEASSRIAVVRYDRTSDATAYFSAKAAVRVIWGGDATIAAIRSVALPPRSFDICFADRYSIAVINPGAVNDATDEEMRRLATAFYNDTYLFDQNACSAPHLILWLNQPGVQQAKDRFWEYVHAQAKAKYQLQPVMAVDKLTALYTQAVNTKIHSVDMPDNLIVRVESDELLDDIERYRCACGYFNECTINSIDEICRIVTPRYQTLAYYGIEATEMQDFVKHCRPIGIDRIVPIGKTTEFSLTWDGYNLIDTLSRIVDIL